MIIKSLSKHVPMDLGAKSQCLGRGEKSYIFSTQVGNKIQVIHGNILKFTRTLGTRIVALCFL